jgi:hypothetical protein
VQLMVAAKAVKKQEAKGELSNLEVGIKGM